jgi:putative transposase
MRKLYVPVRERHHRLPRHRYLGRIVVAFHVCVFGRKPVFVDEAVVSPLRDMLAAATRLYACGVLAYCFMPDHAHVVINGTEEHADTLAAMVEWKNRSGLWLVANAGVRWQKDFYDTILTAPGAAEERVAYVLLNPVNEGMVEDWWDYPFSGQGL